MLNIEIIKKNNLRLGDNVARTAQKVVKNLLNNDIDFEVIIYDRTGIQIGRAPFKKVYE